MPSKTVRSPQEKKELSLDRDRRNDYGENSKASRKNLPKKRAKKNRAVRRGTRTAMASGEDVEVMEKRLASVARKVRKVDGRKSPDSPLRAHIAWRLAARKQMAESKKKAKKS